MAKMEKKGKKNPFKDLVGSKASKAKGEIKPGTAAGKPRVVPQGVKATSEDHVNQKVKGSGHKGSARTGMKKIKVKK